MAAPVDIFVKDNSPLPIMVPDVTVNIYDPSTLEFISGAVTDEDGRAGLLLEAGEYEVRFFKFGYRFNGPKRILVEDPPETTNKFDVVGHDYYRLPASNSMDLCRVSGVFVDFSGRPIRNAMLRISAPVDGAVPKIVGKALVAQDAMEVRTDDNGRFSVDLMREGSYYVTFHGESDVVWNIRVPNSCAWQFTDLLHPYPVFLDFDDLIVPAGEDQIVEVLVGEELIIPFLIRFSDGRVDHKDIHVWFQFLNEVPEVATLRADYSGRKIFIRATSPGTTVISLEMKPGVLPKHWPEPNIVYQSFIVNVNAVVPP